MSLQAFSTCAQMLTFWPSEHAFLFELFSCRTWSSCGAATSVCIIHDGMPAHCVLCTHPLTQPSPQPCALWTGIPILQWKKLRFSPKPSIQQMFLECFQTSGPAGHCGREQDAQGPHSLGFQSGGETDSTQQTRRGRVAVRGQCYYSRLDQEPSMAVFLTIQL